MAQAALVALAAGAQTYSSIEAGRAQRDLSNRNAGLLDRAADDAIARGNETAQAIKGRVRMVRGAQRAALAGQGVDLSTGIGRDLVEDTTNLGEMDVLTAKKNALRDAWGLRTQGSNQRLAGRYAEREGYSRGAGTLLGGMGDSARAYYQFDAPRVAGAG